MKIDFALLLKNKSLKIQRTECADGFEIYEDVIIPRPFEITTCVYFEHDMVYVELKVHYDTKIICSRCLVEFERPQRLFFKEKYTLAQLNETYAQGQIDTVELARDQIILRTSIKNVCKESCQGLCPICGQDKNQHHCDCEKEKKNPYFEKLEILLSDTDKEV